MPRAPGSRYGSTRRRKAAFASPHATSCAGRTPARTSSPMVARLSRNPSRPLSSMAAAWRARTSSGGAGASSHRARVSSPGTGTRRAQQLKERGSSEQIEVARVGVRRLEEMLAGDTASRPTAVEPRQPLLIKSDGAGATGHRTNKPPVQDGENNKSQDRNQKQQIGPAEVAQPEQDPGHAERGQSKL